MIARVGRALASPIGVLITLPLLVVGIGVGVLLLGRDATMSASEELVRRQLATEARAIETDVAFALDQAGPMLEQLRAWADPARTTEDALVRLHDLVVGRPGVAYASISFPDGSFRGAYVDKGEVRAQESRIGPRGTEVHHFAIVGGGLSSLREEIDNYDPRQRDFYTLAAFKHARTWTPPYTFFNTYETGITCAEPIYEGATLRAVLTVDFDVGNLSRFVGRSGIEQARTLLFARDGTVLAGPPQPAIGNKLLHVTDLHDDALRELTAQPRDGIVQFPGYLASIRPVGGKRAGVDLPLEWRVATIVPEQAMLGPAHALERSSIIASAGALAIAVGLAIVLAWNLVRMRRQVAASREEARSAEARAADLGSYRLVAKLGTGGMGEVWRAEHRLLARSAAIKLIRPEALTDPTAVAEVRERFRREAQTLASMRSRHTIAIFDFGITGDGVFYYVMELLDGLDFERLVTTFGAQPAARVIPLLVAACNSLAEAHDAGLLHRDIKPPNLFLSRAADELDVAKLLDFGIVWTPTENPPTAADLQMAETPRLTQFGATLGTPGFMAPEQILGMQLDGRADLYALGCVAWWLLVGKEVFRRDVADAALMRKHVYEQVPHLRDHMPGWCPQQLDTIIASCLAKEPEDRPADARALADALRAIVIPPDKVWSGARALAWWTAYKPPALQAVSPSAVKVIVANKSRR